MLQTQFGKRYANATEEAHRLQNVIKRMADIIKLNFQFKNGNSSYEVDVNEYSDKVGTIRFTTSNLCHW